MSEQSQRRTLGPLAIVLILSGVFFTLFLMISGVMFLYKAPGNSNGGVGSAIFDREGYVGIVEVKGVIVDSRKTLKKLDRLEEDDRVKAVVLRLNTPGGVVGPSQEIYEAVKAFKKPVIVSMGSVAASGGYYIAAGAQKIFANPGTITGSIGVIMEFVNLERLYDWAKVERYSVKTGKFKDSGAEYRKMTLEERQLFQEMIGDVLDQFKKAIVTGRKLSMAKVSELADGRIFSGRQAKAVGLVDELGTLSDAVREAGKLGGIKGKPKAIYIEKQRKGLAAVLLGDSSDDSDLGGESESHFSGALQGLAQVVRFVNMLGQEASPVSTDLIPGAYMILRPPTSVR